MKILDAIKKVYQTGAQKWWPAFMAADGLMIVIIIWLLFFS